MRPSAVGREGQYKCLGGGQGATASGREEGKVLLQVIGRRARGYRRWSGGGQGATAGDREEGKGLLQVAGRMVPMARQAAAEESASVLRRGAMRGVGVLWGVLSCHGCALKGLTEHVALPWHCGIVRAS